MKKDTIIRKHIMLSKVTSIYISVLLSYSAFCQTLDLQVIGSAGNQSINEACFLNYTIGESFIQEYGSTQLYWCEGFHQSNKESTTELKEKSFHRATFEFKIITYPNPAAEYIRVLSPTKCMAILYDLAGKMMNKTSGYAQETDICLLPFPAGIYIIKAFNEKNQMMGISKVIHIEK